MYAKPGGYNSKAFFNGKGGAEGKISLYDPDEIDILREELLNAYSSPREKIITRDELTEIRRTQFALKETQRLTLKNKTKDDTTSLKIKAKQDALKRLYENVLTQKTKKKQQKKRSQSSKSTERSFHKLYTVFYDPLTGAKERIEETVDDASTTIIAKDDAEVQPALKVVSGKAPSPPSKKEEQDKLLESAGKERSKFVLKHRFSSLSSKPPPLLEGAERPRTSHDLRRRSDTRFSWGQDRFSFDVDVYGPFVTYIDPKRQKPKMRHAATQAMVVDDIRLSGTAVDMGSQTELDADSEGRSRGGSSKGPRKEIKGQGRSIKEGELGMEMEEYPFELEEDEAGEHAGGDASSSNPSEADERVEDEDGIDFGKTLERKESKRREAETMARPRGYRDLDLNEPLPYVSFEAETHVTAHDLDREAAKQRGFVLPRDNILWPTCSEFDIDTAAKKIEDYIKRCWTLDPKWLYVIQPLEVYHDSYRKKYIFEVKFSIPSPTTPVPPATASVFFVFEIPIYSMKDDAIKISYVLEGTRFPHHPGQIPFQDKWLWGIISDKLRIQKAVNF